MIQVRAWERLNDPEYSGRLDTREFYDLLIRAGYDRRVAQKAANERGCERLAAGLIL